MHSITGTADTFTWEDLPAVQAAIADVARRTAALWYAKGWREGMAAGYRECAAHQDAALDEQIRAALGAAGHEHLDQQRRRLHGQRRADQLRAAVPRRGDWPGIDNMTGDERTAAHQKLMASWDLP